MPTINRPTVAPDHSRYLAECIFALEPSISRLVATAIAAGWTRSEVVNAIMVLAYDREADDPAGLSERSPLL